LQLLLLLSIEHSFFREPEQRRHFRLLSTTNDIFLTLLTLHHGL
jgi:hypothetical protein